MEPHTRTRALTAAAVALTAGFTLATSLLPSSAHAAERTGRSRSAAVSPRFHELGRDYHHERGFESRLPIAGTAA
jgi:hypothetical protein